jgi:excisionase family DNA binding protein
MEQQPQRSPWMTAEEMAAYAKLSKKLIYAAVASGKLRAARVGAGRNLRGKAEWIDAYLEASAPQEIIR